MKQQEQHSCNMQILCTFITLSLLLSATSASTFDYYADALNKSILFFEGQRSGKLPPNQRLGWRGDSALYDGRSVDVDLTGGYYDAGDNVKYGQPMAFTITLLSWSVIEFGKEMGDQKPYAQEAIKWGTDYLLKATVDIESKGVIYVQVGNPDLDHRCWQRPEDMDSKQRQVYSVSAGSNVAGETAAALAAASLVFKGSNPGYSKTLLERAKVVFDFADKNRASFFCNMYQSSGFNDELMWAASWLLAASAENCYRTYVSSNYQTLASSGDANSFSWDDKNPGIHILLSILDIEHRRSDFKSSEGPANSYVCSLSAKVTPGGLYYLYDGSNLQYVTASSLLVVIYANRLKSVGINASCGEADDLIQKFAKKQVDYILGNNPARMSYMVGFGSHYPQHVHHRGSSITSVRVYSGVIGCNNGALESNKPNPNILYGAVVGGPDRNGNYADARGNYGESEPATYINAPLVGALAYFSSHN